MPSWQKGKLRHRALGQPGHPLSHLPHLCVPTPTIPLGAVFVPLESVLRALALGVLQFPPTPAPHTEVGATFPWVFIAWQARSPLVSQHATYLWRIRSQEISGQSSLRF